MNIQATYEEKELEDRATVNQELTVQNNDDRNQLLSFEEGEVEQKEVVAKMDTTTQHGAIKAIEKTEGKA